MTATAPPATPPQAGPPRQEPTHGAPRRWVRGARYALTPGVLVLVLVSLYAYVSAQQLDRIEQRSLNAAYLASRVVKHIELTAVVATLVLVIAVPLGILLTRPFARRIVAPVLAVANIGQAVPSLGLVILLVVTFLTLGVNQIAVIAFVVYGLLPVLRNTMVGLQQVDRSVLEAARGVGMNRVRVLLWIELPLAVPVILAGVRTTLIITVGTVTLATFVGAGALGDVISSGIASNRQTVLVTGSVLVAVLALLVDWLACIAENALRPRGL